MLRYRNLISFVCGCLFLLSIGCSHQSIRTGDAPKFCELPDGTKVILNQESEIQFIVDDQRREVQLEGEAFFKVVKAEVPFEVHTPHGDVVVLGTEFAVESTDEGLEVEVDEGEVEVKTAEGDRKVRKQERVFYSDVKKLFEHGKAEFKHHIWTDEFKDDMRGLGKEIEKGGKQLGKEIKNLGNDLKIKI